MWCSLQPLIASPQESEEIKHRRQLLERSGALSREAYALGSHSGFRWLTSRKRKRLHQEARLLLKEADPDSIEPLRAQLRTESLKPHANFTSPQEAADRDAIVEGLCEKRAALLRQTDKISIVDKVELSGGKLLLYSPDENLFDGAAKYSSKGFFDVDNIPPWDSWVCFNGIHLVSWVPSVLLDLADAGIDVNPEGCIKWADDESISELFGITSNPSHS
jgi:hypothetical protein